ncbi:uncharacterized protein M421DRAFT_418434 [Didymella exigua CBS 183.55]|uniref:Uncharacterized protein n=1 Tax=Didymella exigua CBS 183.55 TaxID=1150837 RepID=A0A6A5RT04_9PLEO|nr:uncharacterized protein M421DRAFT_418434 [Didymella exigua CBS 183.55]KAF1930952.1 hypothetical protein M421DRAFT_418434 [Didymella exigua CBS 183.55]
MAAQAPTAAGDAGDAGAVGAVGETETAGQPALVRTAAAAADDDDDDDDEGDRDGAGWETASLFEEILDDVAALEEHSGSRG